MNAEKKKIPSWFSESAARAFRVIRAFDVHSPLLKITEIAERAQITRTAARRFALTLIELGYMGEDGGRYFLRPKVLELGFAYISSQRIDQVLQPILRTAAETLHASVDLATLVEFDAVLIARGTINQTFDISLGIGGRIPAHASALGQVLLAGLDSASLERYLEQPKQAYTPRTITNTRLLRERIAQVKASGMAIVQGERHAALSSVALPIRDRTGAVCAAINANTYHSTPTVETFVNDYVPVLRAAAQEIELALAAIPKLDLRP